MSPLPDVAERARRRIACRLLPYLFLLYVIAFLDRINVAYAVPDMPRDLGFTPEVFGFGAGMTSLVFSLMLAGFWVLSLRRVQPASRNHRESPIATATWD